MLLALTLFPASPAEAAPGESRSCMGHELSSISPPGSNPEFPGGAVELRDEVRAIAASFGGIPVGQVYRFIASLHAGSHEACDEALEG